MVLIEIPAAGLELDSLTVDVIQTNRYIQISALSEQNKTWADE